MEVCTYLCFPREAVSALSNAWSLLSALPEAVRLFKEIRRELFAEAEPDAFALADRFIPLAKEAALPLFTVQMLFFLTCVPAAKKNSVRVGLSEKVFRDTMLDLTWKLFETRDVFGVWGVHCAPWIVRILRLTCIALGRLQFEFLQGEVPFCDGDRSIAAGDPTIRVHIPSGDPAAFPFAGTPANPAGPEERANAAPRARLSYPDVRDSYAQAVSFYGKRFENTPIVFCCESWMLYPPVRALLPEGNLRCFCDDYTVVRDRLDPLQDDRWRIFHMPNETPIEDYPEENSLQRALKPYLLSGGRMGEGMGFFFC